MSASASEIERSIVPEVALLHLDPQFAATHSVWVALRSMLINGSPVEVGFVKQVIGDHIVDANERLREEIHSLVMILQDMRVEQAQKPQPSSSSLLLMSSSVPDASATKTGGSLRRRLDQAATFSEFAASKEQDLLKSRLQKLFTTSTEAAETNPNTSSSSGLSTLTMTARERQVAEFVVTGRPSSAAGRPMSRSSVASSSASSDWLPRPVSRSEASSRASHADPTCSLKPLASCLGFERVKEVVVPVRQLFADEKALLEEDADSVRGWIEDELTMQRFVPPTPAEIRTLGKRVERWEADAEHAERVAALPSASPPASSDAPTALLPLRGLAAASPSIAKTSSMDLAPVSGVRKPLKPVAPLLSESVREKKM